MHTTFGFIGLGLIGGSVAKALKKADSDCTIIAYDVDQASLELAKKENIADVITDSINNEFQECDYIFLCTPVSFHHKQLEEIKKIKKASCIITDVGSVKGSVHTTIADLGLEHCFIGGHPMAGSEKSGYAASKASLLENAYYILTPTKKVAEEDIHGLFTIIESMKALPLILSPKQHDDATAAISHLPHMLAFSLVNTIREKDSDGIMKMIAAGGFKDITRIASSSPVMWEQISIENNEALLHMLDCYIEGMSSLREKIAEKDSAYLNKYFSLAKDYRDSFTTLGNGIISRTYHLSLYVPDESGAIAKVSTLFAQNHISIKNIGIVHNREYEEGALQVEFYDENSLARATALLKEKQYQIFTK